MLHTGLFLSAAAPGAAQAACSASGTLASGSTVTCTETQTTRVGQGPGADNVSVTVKDGATVSATNSAAISLHDNATITLGTSGSTPGGSASNAPVVVQATTNGGASRGTYLTGSNAIDVGSNSTILINRNAAVIATGTQTTSEAINPIGTGNRITNYGLIQGGPSSAIFFENRGATATDPRNVVDNFGTIQLQRTTGSNPVTGGQAVSSYGNVGIDFINESGARVIGNLQLQGGSDRVTFNPGSSVSGSIDGGGNNLLTLNASANSADTFTGQLNNFQTLEKTGGGIWTLTGSIGNNTATGAAPLTVNVRSGILVLTGDNARFDGTITINPGSTAAQPGADATATLEARAQSLPPLITDHGVLRFNQASPDGIQSADGTYAGLIQGTGSVEKTGPGTTVLQGINPFTGTTTVTEGTLAIGDATHGSAALSGGGAVTVAAGATLGGYGSVAGDVDNSGIVSVANAIPAFAAGPVGTFTIGGSLRNAGDLNLAGPTVGNTLAVRGTYTGAGGTLTLNTVLNEGGPLANQSTDRLLVGGNALGTTTIRINGIDSGAATGVPAPDSGISIVQVGGASTPNAFTLANGYVTGGTPYQYRLFAYGPGSVNGTASTTQNLVGAPGQQWDYRLQSAYVTPGGNLVSVGQVGLLRTPGLNPITTGLPTTGGFVITTGTTNPSANQTPAAPPGTTQPTGGSQSSTLPFRVSTVGVTPNRTASVTPTEPVTVTAQTTAGQTITTPVVPAGSSGTPDPLAVAQVDQTGAGSALAPPDARPAVAPQVASYITAPTALFNAGFQDIDSLMRRLGELRDDPGLGRGDASAESFVRAYGGRFNYATNRSFTNYGYNSSQDYAAMQFGGSRIVHAGDGGTLRIGLAGTLGELWVQPNAADGASKALFHTETLAGIMTWLSRRGWYVDVIVSGGMFDGQVKTPAAGQVAGLNGTSVNASLEGGYPIALGWQQLTLEPQAQVVFQHLDFARRTDADGIALNLGSPNQGILRMGARLTRSFTGADGVLFTPYLKANVLQGLGGGNAVRLSGVAFGTGDFGTALQVGGGITGGLSRRLSLYGEVAWQQSVGNGGFRGWAFNGGLRFSF